MSDESNVTTPDAADESAGSSIPPREEARGSDAASAAEARTRTIRAVEAALKGSTPEDTTEAATNEGDPDAPGAPPEKDAPAEPKTPAERSKFAVTARAREQAQRTIAAAEERARRVADQERLLVQRSQNFDAEVDRRAHAALQQRLAGMKKAPAKLLQELGLPPEEFVKAFVTEGQPDPIAEAKDELSQMRAELEAFKAAQARERAAAEEAQVVSRFTGMVTGAPDKFPALIARYGDTPARLVKKADEVAVAFHRKTGEHASWTDIAEYLEHEEREVHSKYAKHAGQKTGQSQGQPPQVERGTGPRSTLSTRRTSQRATANVPHRELSPDEQREHLKAVAEKAMREAEAKG